MKPIFRFFVTLAVAVCSLPLFGQEPEFGWTPDPEETERFVRTIPAIYSDQVRELIVGDENADVLLYRSLIPCLEKHGKADWIKVRGQYKVVRAYDQNPTGSCVGNAAAFVLSALNGVEIILKDEPQEFVAMHSADGMYGLGREMDNRLGVRSQGMSGSGMAKAITQMGTLYCIQYGAADLTKNSPERQYQYGLKGVGDALKAEATKHKIRSVIRVKSAQEGWSLIGNGYPINVCSGVGFVTKKRDSEGIIQPSGSWGHSMAVIARRTTKDGRKLFLIMNSWGDDWASGPYWEDMPMGSFWVEWSVMDRMFRAGDSFAYSDLDGFPGRTLPDFGSKEYLGKIIVQPKEVYHAGIFENVGPDRPGGNLRFVFSHGSSAFGAGTAARDPVPGRRSGLAVPRHAVRFYSP